MNQINFVVLYTSKNCCLTNILIKVFISLLNLVVSVFDRIVSIRLSISKMFKLGLSTATLFDFLVTLLFAINN
jgi:hypothetical protein